MGTFKSQKCEKYQQQQKEFIFGIFQDIIVMWYNYEKMHGPVYMCDTHSAGALYIVIYDLRPANTYTFKNATLCVKLMFDYPRDSTLYISKIYQIYQNGNHKRIQYADLV